MAFMRHDILAFPNRWRLAGLCLLYAGIMLYSSTLIGPTGINFVARDPADAFKVFLSTRYVDHGSDQRADWVGNLLMLVPLGFMVTAVIWPRRTSLRLLAALGAVSVCIVTISSCSFRRAR